MGDERYTTQQTTSSPRSTRSTSPHQVAYAIERAKVLFGSYRRGDANDPDAYVAAISAVLSRYDTDLIREVTDPNTGICTTEKYMSFMPNAGELKVYCEAIVGRRDRLQKLGELPRPDFNRPRLAAPPPAPGCRAKIFVPASNARYQQMLDWSKTADPLDWKFEQRPGIWVSHAAWESRAVAPRQPRTEPMTSLKLSDVARRTMAELDVERSGNLPIDMPQEFVD